MKIKPILQTCRKLGIVCIPLFFLSCHNFFKVASGPAYPKKPDSVMMAYPNRFFILQSGRNNFYMRHPVLSPDRKTVNCTLSSLPMDHRLYLTRGIKGNMRYKKNKMDSVVLSEVYFYIPLDSSIEVGSSYTLDLAKVRKVEILIKDKSRTTESYILGGVAITLGVIAVAAIIVAATKSSCPFVSAYDSNRLVLQGEIYGGAIYPQLARSDYLQLKMSPLVNGNLQVRISNELKERQYTDLAELLVFTHRKEVQMRMDEKGRIYSISNPTLPISAIAGERNILDLLQSPNDTKVYAFDDTLQKNGNHVDIKFSRPAYAKNAKLVLQLKNSYWLDLVYGKMTEGFGAYYSKFIQSQYSQPIEVLKKWTREQQLPLSVFLSTGSGWKHIEDITTFGPLANRETVVPLNLDSITGNSFTVRLSCGFMFWELDYAAVDFSGPGDYVLTVLPPKNAIDETGRDVTESIASADGKYLEQPVPGNATDIEYTFRPNTDSSKTQTFFLHAKGYYEHVRNYNGAPNITFLNQFKKPDALSEYSLQLYKDVLRQDLHNTASGSPLAAEPLNITR